MNRLIHRQISRPAPRMVTFRTIQLLGLVGWLWLVGNWAAAEDRQPNIVILYADDWRHDTLGAAGNTIVQTPRLDEFASQGIRFTHHYVTTSICGVSRASLLTGQWMSRHGNRGFAAFQTPWSQTYPGIFREQGYHTGYIGKWHCGPFPQEQFDLGISYSGQHWYQDADGQRIHVTQRNERDAIDFLRKRPTDRPFCLTVAFFAAHAEDGNPQQYLPQTESMELYKDVEIPVPTSARDEYLQRLPAFLAAPQNEGRVRWHWRFDTAEKYQSSMKNYYRLVSEVDATCGRIIDELKRQALWENTIVIFTTDNGYFHGEHGLADKWYPYQESIRVPLIVYDPRMNQAHRGKQCEELTLNVDIAPTLLTSARLPLPPNVQGQDFSWMYLSTPEAIGENPAPRPPWRSDFFYEHPTITNRARIPSSQALVSKTMKYIEWVEYDQVQLFDLAQDPLEIEDQSANPAYGEKLKWQRNRLQELRALAK